MNGGTIAGNHTAGKGGGVYLYYSNTAIFTTTDSSKGNWIYNNGSVYNQFQEIYAFIRLVASGVVIGTSNTEIKMKLVGDTLFFFTGNEENVTVDNAIAYFKSNQLVVANSRINVLSIGSAGSYMHFSVIGSGSTKCLFMSPREV